jgi:hypothetical protein
MSEDRLTKEIWLGDAGEAAGRKWTRSSRVEISAGDCYEGFVIYEPDGCPPGGFISPRAVYDHSDECAIVGGYVYRGEEMPELYGWYIYGDFCTGEIWAVDVAPGATSPPVSILNTPYTISSFAGRPDGEILVLTYYSDAIYLLHNDGDGDGLGADEDNCPTVNNSAPQMDTDGDMAGDECDDPGSGNVDCSAPPNGVSSVDALEVLRHNASLSVTQNEPCLDIGQMLPFGRGNGGRELLGRRDARELGGRPAHTAHERHAVPEYQVDVPADLRALAQKGERAPTRQSGPIHGEGSGRGTQYQ